MSRPKKATVDYFPHFVNHGKTLYILEQDYGNDGYAFWFKLLEILGNTEHHFYDCNLIGNFEFLCAKTRLSGVIVDEILTKLANLEAIDNKLWEIRVIRSQNFIDNLSMLYNRRGVNVYSNPEVWDLCIQKPHNGGIIVDENPQSKVKYSKVEEKKDIILSSKDDPQPFRKPKNNQKEEIAKRVIDYLNEKRGTKFKYSKANIGLIVARLKENFSEDDLKKVIDNQVIRWTGIYFGKGDDKKNAEQYIRPSTLFRPSNCDSYLNNELTDEEKKRFNAFVENKEYKEADDKLWADWEKRMTGTKIEEVNHG